MAAAPQTTGDPIATQAAEIARAARVLAIRSRRQATGLFAGAYTSAIRGGGIEFHESRPYVPGDDVRNIDWNAMARTGEPFVKCFREERDQTLLLGLDVSASMRFGTGGQPKASTAAHAAALLAAAAGQAGDRVGLVAFDERVRTEVAPSRGSAHTWHVIRSTAVCAGHCAGTTRIASGVDALLARSGPGAVCVLLSDFRDADLLAADAGDAAGALASLARRHDVVSAVLHDPREESLPRAGLVRIEDPERPGRTLLLNSNRTRARNRYRRAWAARSQALERTLRRAGSDVVWLRNDRDPLGTWMRFFRERASGARRAR